VNFIKKAGLHPQQFKTFHEECGAEHGDIAYFATVQWLSKGATLTLSEPPGLGDFRKKNSSFRLPYQRPSSSAHCARELFKSSNGSASLVDCNRKKIFCLGVRFFLSDVTSGGLFGNLGNLCLTLGVNR